MVWIATHTKKKIVAFPFKKIFIASFRINNIQLTLEKCFFFFLFQIFTPYFFPLYSRLHNTGPNSILSVYLRTGLDHLHVIFNEKGIS